jgi:hypothetical protein
MKWLLLAAAAFVSACATSPDAVVTRRYMCDDGSAFFARYGADQVVLDFGAGGTKRLAARPGGTPGSYAQGDDAFQVRETGDATLMRAGRPPVSCLRGDVRDLAVIR